MFCNEYSFRPASCFFWTAVRPLGAVSLLAEGSGRQCGSAIIGLCFGCRMHVDHPCSSLACPRVDHLTTAHAFVSSLVRIPDSGIPRVCD